MFDIEYKGANAIVFATKKVRVVFDPNSAVSQDSSLKPNNKISFSKSKARGRFINIPLLCSNSNASSRDSVSSLFLRSSSLYTKPLVLNNFFSGKSKVSISFLKVSTVGVDSFTLKYVASIL